MRLYQTFSEFIATEVPDIRALREGFEFRIRQEPGLRDQLIAYLVAAADEEGPALLEPHLVNTLLPAWPVRFGSFEPLDDPGVAGAAASDGHEVFDISSKGRVPVTLYVTADPRPTTPDIVPVIDEVEVEYMFKVTYDLAAGAILGAELVGIRSLATDVRGLIGRAGRLPRSPTP